MDFKKNHAFKASVLILLLGIILIFLIFFAAPPDNAFSGYKVSDSNDAASFLSDFGWEVDTQNITQQNSVLPDQFDALFTEYNALQLQQGCDLSKYAGKEITVYTVPIKNYGDASENIYATILVHNDQVIGGDIHSAELNGFMHTLR